MIRLLRIHLSWPTALAAMLVVLGSAPRALAQIPPTCATVASAGSTLPPVTLAQGENYFRVGGVPTLLLGENPFLTCDNFMALLDGIKDHQKIVRLHLSNGIIPDPKFAGDLDLNWATNWDNVINAAENDGLYVLPVLDVWSNWSTNPLVSGWSRSVYNVASLTCSMYDPMHTHTCRPATDPSELLLSGSDTQTAWLSWAEAAVNHFKSHANIVGWEIFSELDNVDGANAGESNGVSFVAAASAQIRAADPGRLITASLSGTNAWPTLSSSNAIDFLELHPYAGPQSGYDNNLDAQIVDSVSDARTNARAVFIGESGLDTDFPLDPASSVENALRAPVGINQAIWAGAVSGAMNARMLWFEDGYDHGYNLCADTDPAHLGSAYAGDPRCTNPGTLLLHEVYEDAAVPVERLLAGVDFSGFVPVTMTPGADLIGGAVGNDNLVLGWVRDTASAAPDWPWRPLSGEQVTVAVQGQSADWLVDFYDTTTGDVVSTIDADQDASGNITFTLPDFEGSLGFKVYAVPPLQVTLSIRPKGPRNIISWRHPEPFPSAILSTSTAAGDATDFDATMIDPASIRFGPAGAAPIGSRVYDVNGDGIPDLEFEIRALQTGFACGDTSASVTAQTFTGRTVEGSDFIRIVGCPRRP